MSDWRSSVEAWLTTNDLTIELTAVWVLWIGFAVLGAVKIVSWWTLRNQVDMTSVGRSLKWQKFMEVIMASGMSTLYGLTLWGYYVDYRFNVWEQLVVRTFVVVGILGASVWGLLFVRALITERRPPDRPP